ncbi:hypothetical protein [Deinococcus aquaticus]|uniref:hypothetical protein n=1 Tax=Deinococcus aquaticus TaxID=328692 RepID=UPI00360DF265
MQVIGGQCVAQQGFLDSFLFGIAEDAERIGRHDPREPTQGGHFLLGERNEIRPAASREEAVQLGAQTILLCGGEDQHVHGSGTTIRPVQELEEQEVIHADTGVTLRVSVRTPDSAATDAPVLVLQQDGWRRHGLVFTQVVGPVDHQADGMLLVLGQPRVILVDDVLVEVDGLLLADTTTSQLLLGAGLIQFDLEEREFAVLDASESKFPGHSSRIAQPVSPYEHTLTGFNSVFVL